MSPLTNDSMTALTLNLSSLVGKVSDHKLELLSRDNPDIRLETNCHGHLVALPPTVGVTGIRNGELSFQIGQWNKQSQLGKVFGSSAGFKLSNGSVRSPDVSWVSLAKWDSLTKTQRRTFAPIDPDFVIELMSPTDSLDEIRNKMREYICCGVKLGWLINPDGRQVEIYRLGKDPETVDNPQTLSGEDVMPNLIVNLSEIFD